jgi:hypothetical protein
MLLPIIVLALLCALGAWAVARGARHVTERLGADPMTMLVWFGLAEDATAQPRAQRGRLDGPVGRPRPGRPQRGRPRPGRPEAA